MFPGNIPQDGPRAMDRAHLPEGGFRSLLDAGMPIGDDQLNPGKSPLFEVFEQS